MRTPVYGVWAVRDGSSRFGPAEAWCKENGAPLEFSSLEDAQAYAQILNSQAAPNIHYHAMKKPHERDAVQQDNPERLYFAYGSNINLGQMAYRCPDAQVVGPVMLEDYELLFRGNGSGNGVATIAPKGGSYVYGLLWKLTPGCERSLDHYEGYPRLYRKETVTVFDTEGRKLRVMAYVMNGRSLTPTLPSTRYFNGIREGFVQNGLPVKRLHMALNHVMQEVQEQRDALPPWYRSAKPRNPNGKER